MIYRVFVILMVLVSTKFFSQTGTVSPYSFTGVGESLFKGNAINRVMGGLDVFTDSIHINLNNPTSYGKLKLTAYALGINYSEINLNDNTNKENSRSASIDYLAVAIPTKRFGFGFGIIPFSSVGYKIKSETPKNGVINQFNGEGGINKAFLSVGFELASFFSIGGTINYNFGKIKSLVYQSNEEIDSGTFLENISDYSGLDYSLATNFTFIIGEKVEIQSFFAFSPTNKLVSKNQRVFYTRSKSSGSIGDYRTVDLESLNLDENKVTTFSKIDFGLGFGQRYKWSIGSQYTYLNASGFNNEFMVFDNLKYSSGSKFSFGGFYIPNYLSISNYWNRVVYRAGIRIEKPGILINNNFFHENALSFGMSLPLAMYSSATLAFEIGNRKIKNSKYFKEIFWSVRVGLSLTDFWFIKRKYN